MHTTSCPDSSIPMSDPDATIPAWQPVDLKEIRNRFADLRRLMRRAQTCDRRINGLMAVHLDLLDRIKSLERRLAVDLYRRKKGPCDPDTVSAIRRILQGSRMVMDRLHENLDLPNQHVI